MTSPGGTSEEHVLNVIGAFVTTCHDALEAELASATEIGGAGPAALLCVSTWPGSSIDRLSRTLRLTHSGTVRLVDRLVQSGHVSRRPGPDRRTTSLHLTDKGVSLADRLRSARYALLSNMLPDLDTAERATLTSLLEKALRARARTRAEARAACRLCDHSVCVGEECPIGASVP